MVSHCANPDCGAPFLYFSEGKLIALKRRVQPGVPERVEFFWLCGKCMNQVPLDGALHIVLDTLTERDIALFA